MLKSTSRVVAALSRRWWAIALLALAIVWLMRRLTAISTGMKAITGAEAFDMQHSLTVAEIAAQLPLYTPQAVALYGKFAGTDFLFPFVATLFWVALALWGLRRARPQIFAAGHWERWVPWFFVGCVCDWTENVANAWLIGRYPPLNATVAALSVFAKQAKIAAVVVTAVVAVALALWGASVSITRFVQRRAT